MCSLTLQYNVICDASQQNSANVGNFKIELSVHLSIRKSFCFYIFILRIYGMIHYCGWNRGVRKINLAEIGCKV